MKEPQKVQCEKCKKVSRPATSFCRDCGQFICARCSDIHADWEEFSSHEVVSMDQLKGDVAKHVPPKKVTHFCLKHKDQELRLYCETCGELICHDCTIRLHQGHQYDLISDTFEGHKADITASLEPVEKQMGIVSDKLKQLDARCTEITEQRTLVKANIHKEICGFIEMLKRREAELARQVDQQVEPKLKNLAAQRDEMETIHAQLGSCLSFVRESLRIGSQGEIVKMKKRVVKQIKEMTAEFNGDALAPCEEANFDFATLPSFAKDCQEVGEVYLKASTEKSYATGKGLEVATVNEKATASVYALDHHGKPCAHSIARMTCELTSENDAKTIDGSIRKVKGNQYEISYCPISRERHQLYIKFDDKHIKASPFAVTVGIPIKKLGAPVMTITGLSNPWGVAVNKKGEIIISESTAHRVSVYSQAGEKLRSFGSYGSGKGQFKYPRGVAVDDDADNILVADSSNHRIQKFTADGKLIIAVGSLESKPLQFNCPTGIAVHPESKLIYVSESVNHRVQVLKPNLASHKLFGSSGSGKGEFYQPRGIAFDSKQNVYVGECRANTHIQVFTQGEHSRWLGDTKLNCPFDVCIDSNDIAYVCDTNNHRICIFDSSGTLLHSFGTQGKSPGQFSAPYGITIDNNGLLYVNDYYNGQVQIF